MGWAIFFAIMGSSALFWSGVVFGMTYPQGPLPMRWNWLAFGLLVTFSASTLSFVAVLP